MRTRISREKSTSEKMIMIVREKRSEEGIGIMNRVT